MDNIEIVHELTSEQMDDAAAIFYDAFELKLKYLYLFPKSPEQGKRILSTVIRFKQGIYAISNKKVIGVAGLEMSDSQYFIELDFGILKREFGFIGAVFRWCAYKIYLAFEKSPPADTVYLHSLAAAKDARGQGVGTLLLDAVKEFTRIQARSNVVLSVADTNPRAEALYKREGFNVIQENTFGIFTYFTKKAQFSKTRVMKYDL